MPIFSVQNFVLFCPCNLGNRQKPVPNTRRQFRPTPPVRTTKSPYLQTRKCPSTAAERGEKEREAEQPDGAPSRSIDHNGRRRTPTPVESRLRASMPLEMVYTFSGLAVTAPLSRRSTAHGKCTEPITPFTRPVVMARSGRQRP